MTLRSTLYLALARSRMTVSTRIVGRLASAGYAPPELFRGEMAAENGTASVTDLLAEVCYADLPRRWLLLSGRGTGSAWSASTPHHCLQKTCAAQ